jgi:hypothetical protein
MATAAVGEEREMVGSAVGEVAAPEAAAWVRLGSTVGEIRDAFVGMVVGLTTGIRVGVSVGLGMGVEVGGIASAVWVRPWMAISAACVRTASASEIAGSSPAPPPQAASSTAKVVRVSKVLTNFFFICLPDFFIKLFARVHYSLFMDSAQPANSLAEAVCQYEIWLSYGS